MKSERGKSEMHPHTHTLASTQSYTQAWVVEQSTAVFTRTHDTHARTHTCMHACSRRCSGYQLQVGEATQAAVPAKSKTTYPPHSEQKTQQKNAHLLLIMSNSLCLLFEWRPYNKVPQWGRGKKINRFLFTASVMKQDTQTHTQHGQYETHHTHCACSWLRSISL